jgi:mono/diheme cytochrome c family protein
VDIWPLIHPVSPALVLPSHTRILASPVLGGAVSPILLQADWLDPLFRIILVSAAIIFLAVEGLLLYAVFRFRQASDGEAASRIRPRPGLELVWTLIPAVLVIIIAVFSFRLLSSRKPPGAGGDVPASQDMTSVGESVFATYGCSSCHTLKAVGAKGTVGPDLDGVGQWAGEIVPGMDAESFLHQAILEPNAYIADGYEADIMPANFSSRLSPAQLSGLIAFLLTQK